MSIIKSAKLSVIRIAIWAVPSQWEIQQCRYKPILSAWQVFIIDFSSWLQKTRECFLIWAATINTRYHHVPIHIPRRIRMSSTLTCTTIVITTIASSTFNPFQINIRSGQSEISMQPHCSHFQKVERSYLGELVRIISYKLTEFAITDIGMTKSYNLRFDWHFTVFPSYMNMSVIDSYWHFLGWNSFCKHRSPYHQYGSRYLSFHFQPSNDLFSALFNENYVGIER